MPTCSTARAAATATSRARGSALPMSSEARIDHPPHDEARVLAALEHHREVVERGVGIGAARGLDPGRDVVVVLIAAAVVAHGLALHGVLGLLERDAPSGGAVARQLERGQRGPRVAAGAAGQELEHLVARPRRPTLAALQRTAQQRARTCSAVSGPQLVDLGARQQRGVDLEVGVLGRRADQRDEALLDRRQQRVLLGLVEAVDLVEEEDRRLARGRAPVRGPLDHRAHLGACRPRRRSPPRTPRWRSRRRSARASSSRSRAARRGSSSAAGPPRSPGAGPSRVRAGAPGRRRRRATTGACARPAAPPREGRACARGALHRARTIAPWLTVSIPRAMDLIAFAAWCFLVALAGGLVGLVLGNIRLPAAVLLGSSPGAAAGANIGISAVSAATASIAHVRAGRVNWRLFGWMAPPSIVGAARRGLRRGRAAGRRPAARDRGGAPLLGPRPAALDPARPPRATPRTIRRSSTSARPWPPGR